MKKKLLLMILDGWEKENKIINVIHNANTPFVESL